MPNTAKVVTWPMNCIRHGAKDFFTIIYSNAFPARVLFKCPAPECRSYIPIMAVYVKERIIDEYPVS